MKYFLCCGVLLILLGGTIQAQHDHYPRWFFEQGRVCRGNTIMGYTKSSFFADSSARYAIQEGYSLFARQKQLYLHGGQAFWSTEIGTFWMGSSFAEEIDSSWIEIGKSVLTPLDTCRIGDLVCVLLGSQGCELTDDDRIRYSSNKVIRPKWVETPPEDNTYFYAVGAAPFYFYEVSCWRKAEELAFRNLARNVLVTTMAMQKQAEQSQEIRDEQLEITLFNIQLVGRYIDPQTQIHYVLVRMKK